MQCNSMDWFGLVWFAMNNNNENKNKKNKKSKKNKKKQNNYFS